MLNIRTAVESDIPLILSFIKALAETVLPVVRTLAHDERVHRAGEHFERALRHILLEHQQA